MDIKAFSQLWQKGNWETIQYISADKGYDYFDVRNPIKKTGKIPVIPRRENALVPSLPDIYKSYYHTRSTTERFFGSIKENKCLALRFDKLTIRFFSFFCFSSN